MRRWLGLVLGVLVVVLLPVLFLLGKVVYEFSSDVGSNLEFLRSIPVHPRSTLLGPVANILSSQVGNEYSTSDNPEGLITFYKTMLIGSDWTFIDEQKTAAIGGTYEYLLNFTKSDRVVTISIGPNPSYRAGDPKLLPYYYSLIVSRSEF